LGPLTGDGPAELARVDSDDVALPLLEPVAASKDSLGTFIEDADDLFGRQVTSDSEDDSATVFFNVQLIVGQVFEDVLDRDHWVALPLLERCAEL
jgi:hypothetical protein